jgi:phage FluMu gp28-like protein
VFPARDALLLSFQRRWLEDTSRLKIMEKARQIGLSWATAYRLVRDKARKDCRTDAWISSRDDLQARLLIEDCKHFAAVLKIGAEDLGERVIDETQNSAYVLSFANGHRIHSMSSNPNAQAGKRGDRVLDEFALHPDPRKLWSIAYPGITWGGSMEVISTHRGVGNFFNTLIQEVKEKGNPKGVSLHTVTLADALEAGFLYKLQCKLPLGDPRQEMDEADYYNLIRSGCADEESFRQEFCCQPSDDATAFIPYELLDSNGVDGWAKPLAECGEIYIGVDVGRDHDLTVIWAVEKEGSTFTTRAVVEMQAEKFSAQEARLYDILQLPNVRRACIDSTGIGRQFAERAQDRFGNYKVEAVNFTGPVKEALAYPVRAALEDHTFKLPREKKVEADFRAIRKETTAAGNIRFAADRGKNGHSDRFWAAALALHAAQPPVQTFTVTNIF